jgi:hypothetical protein
MYASTVGGPRDRGTPGRIYRCICGPARRSFQEFQRKPRCVLRIMEALGNDEKRMAKLGGLFFIASPVSFILANL